jgi:hypothetical protein
VSTFVAVTAAIAIAIAITIFVYHKVIRFIGVEYTE